MVAEIIYKLLQISNVKFCPFKNVARIGVYHVLPRDIFYQNKPATNIVKKLKLKIVILITFVLYTFMGSNLQHSSHCDDCYK